MSLLIRDRTVQCVPGDIVDTCHCLSIGTERPDGEYRLIDHHGPRGVAFANQFAAANRIDGLSADRRCPQQRLQSDRRRVPAKKRTALRHLQRDQVDPASSPTANQRRRSGFRT